MRLSRLAQALTFTTATLVLTACGSDSETTNTIVDATPPLLTTNSDFIDGSTAVAAVFVTGQVEDTGGIKSLDYRFKDQPAQALTINTDGRFSASILLTVGDNELTLTATDTAGNNTKLTKHIYLGDKVAAGGSHTGTLKNGQIYGWGRNNFGQTGLGKTTKLAENNGSAHRTHPDTPIMMSPALNNFASIAFNQNHSLAISKDGKVYSWGEDRSGQLGRGNMGRNNCSGIEDCRLDIGAIAEIDNAVMVAAGYKHNLVLTADGIIWAFGANSEGQLGNGGSIDSSVPVKVDFSAAANIGHIIQVAASASSSYALDDKGQVWGWGSDDYANLGKGKECTRANSCLNVNATPVPINVIKDTATGEKVMQLAAGRDHVLALTNKDLVYAWGLNASSQIGYNGANYKNTADAWKGTITSPTKLPWFINKEVSHIYANGNTSYVLLENGKIYPWGVFGETNSAGTTIYNNLNEPTDRLPSLTEIDNIAMGAMHFIAQDKTNNLYTWGWSFEGSLGSELATHIWMYNIPFPINLPSQ